MKEDSSVCCSNLHSFEYQWPVRVKIQPGALCLIAYQENRICVELEGAREVVRDPGPLQLAFVSLIGDFPSVSCWGLAQSNAVEDPKM